MTITFKNDINSIVWTKTPHTGYPLTGNPVPWKLWHIAEYMDGEAERNKKV